MGAFLLSKNHKEIVLCGNKIVKIDGLIGELMSGWIAYKGKKCYLNEKHDGTFGRAMKNETIEINGVKYSFDKDGYLIEK